MVTKAELKIFLDHYDRLAQFEGSMRGMGRFWAFSKEEVDTFPIPEIVKVYNWLKEGVKEDNGKEEQDQS